MFNSFLPILLEARIDPSSVKGGRTEALEELLLYSLGGCPGAIVRFPSLLALHPPALTHTPFFPSLLFLRFFFFFQIGAYLIQTPHFNRRSTLSIFTVLTALSTLAFAAVSSKGGVIVSSMAISLAGSVMYSVLYAMTPEVSFAVLKGLRREEEEGKKKRRT